MSEAPLLPPERSTDARAVKGESARPPRTSVSCLIEPVVHEDDPAWQARFEVLSAEFRDRVNARSHLRVVK